MNHLLKSLLLTFCIILLLPVSSFALSLAGGQITFDIPEALELRNKELNDFNNALQAIVAKQKNLDFSKSQLVLQQKGLNEMNIEGLAQYCRVMLKILPPNPQMPMNNNEFAQMVSELSASEMKEFNQVFMDAITQNDPFTKVHQWLEANSVMLGSKFALKYHYDRYSNGARKSNQLVDVCVYVIVTKDFMINLTCSYRMDDRPIFEPAINQFLSSIRIKAE